MSIITLDEILNKFGLITVSIEDLNNFSEKIKADLLKAFTFLQTISLQPIIFKTIKEDIFFIIFVGEKTGVVNYTSEEFLSEKTERLGEEIAKFIDGVRGIEFPDNN